MLLRKTVISALLLLAFSPGTIYGQPELIEETIADKSAHYEDVVENFHLHLNKTSFVRGEHIWFKAYVYNQISQKPSFETTNLNVALFDEDGSEVKRKLIYIENGVGYGDFAIDSTLTNKKYYISAWTNWMKNFEQSNSFHERIEIINSSDAQVKDLFPNTEYQIDVYPEGGSVLADTENVMAIHWKGYKKILDKIRVRLLTSGGDTIIDPIRLTSNGLGKFTYRHRNNKNYELHFAIEGGQTIVKKLPSANNQGVSLMVNSLHPSNVHVQVLTNERNFPFLQGKLFTLTVSGQDSTHIRQIYVSGLKQSLAFEKKFLSDGINHLILENEQGVRLASRNFYNNQSTLEDQLVLDSYLTEQGDSVEVSLSFKEPVQESFSLSVSTLPIQSRAYRPANSLKTSLTIKPFLADLSSDVRFSYEGSSRKKYYEWDALLLNRDIVKYPTVMFNNPKISSDYPWEEGIRINGWAKNADLEREKFVWIYSGSMENTLIGYLEKDKTFKTDAVLYQNDSITFALVDDKGRMRQPVLKYVLEPKKSIQRLNIKELPPVFDRSREVVDENWILPFDVSDQTIELDEVELVARKPQMKFQVNATTEFRLISDTDIKRRPSLYQYIKSLGFHIFLRPDGFNITRYLNPVLARDLPLIIDGMVETTPSALQTPLSRVEYITYDPLGFISVGLRKYDYRSPDAEPLYLKFQIENGFNRPSKFKTPFYSSYTNTFFNYYGTIDWKPMLNLDGITTLTFKIPRLNQDAFKLIIEGMGSEGTLISTVKELKLNEEQVD